MNYEPRVMMYESDFLNASLRRARAAERAAERERVYLLFCAYMIGYPYMAHSSNPDATYSAALNMPMGRHDGRRIVYGLADDAKLTRWHDEQNWHYRHALGLPVKK